MPGDGADAGLRLSLLPEMTPVAERSDRTVFRDAAGLILGWQMRDGDEERGVESFWHCDAVVKYVSNAVDGSEMLGAFSACSPPLCCLQSSSSASVQPWSSSSLLLAAEDPRCAHANQPHII